MSQAKQCRQPEQYKPWNQQISGRKRDYWKGKINEVRKKRRDIQHLYRGINEFKEG